MHDASPPPPPAAASPASASPPPLDTWSAKVIYAVERLGNRLPHPFTLFTLLALGTLLLSAVVASAEVSVSYVVQTAAGPETRVVAVRNLLERDYLRTQLGRLVAIYAGFPPLGLAMIMILGVGVLEQSGLISALIRKTILKAPSALVTACLAFVGVNANLASEAGVIFTPIIGAALFKAVGRHPYLGIAAGYAAASGGFAANLLVAGTDALLSGITASAAAATAIQAPVHPAINWYFMIASTFAVTAIVTAVTERSLAARFPAAGVQDEASLAEHALSADEERGLRFAAAGLALFVGALLWGTLPADGFLRGEGGELLPKSPLLEGVVTLLFAGFVTIGIAFGVGARTITSERDVPRMMESGLRGALAFLVVALPASLFIHFFGESRLALVLAVKGAAALEALHVGGPLVLLLLILFTAFLNLFLPSGSAKWLILAPIFVPMFGALGHSPAATQIAFRVGDCSTNVISPFKSYLPVLLGLLEQHRAEGEEPVGIGTLIALELPYSLALLLGLSLMVVAWCSLGIPLGPGVSPTL